jgi:hypothetical protein
MVRAILARALWRVVRSTSGRLLYIAGSPAADRPKFVQVAAEGSLVNDDLLPDTCPAGSISSTSSRITDARTHFDVPIISQRIRPGCAYDHREHVRRDGFDFRQALIEMTFTPL